MPPRPKRSDQRRRRNKMPGLEKAPAGQVTIPEPDPQWHPIARRWFDSLHVSGQAQFFEQSDWAMAELGASLISHTLASGRPSSQMVAQINTIAGELMMTEGSRRKARLELIRASSDEADEDAARVVELRERFAT